MNRTRAALNSYGDQRRRGQTKKKKKKKPTKESSHSYYMKWMLWVVTGFISLGQVTDTLESSIIAEQQLITGLFKRVDRCSPTVKTSKQTHHQLLLLDLTSKIRDDSIPKLESSTPRNKTRTHLDGKEPSPRHSRAALDYPEDWRA
jgi:hypothetical protein